MKGGEVEEVRVREVRFAEVSVGKVKENEDGGGIRSEGRGN